METIDLGFCTVNFPEYRIVEIIVHATVELKVEHAEQIHRLYKEKLEQPYGVMVNNINSFSYDYFAMKKLAETELALCIARVNYTSAAAMTSKMVKNVVESHSNHQMSVENFEAKEDALVWLRKRIQEDEEAAS